MNPSEELLAHDIAPINAPTHKNYERPPATTLLHPLSLLPGPAVQGDHFVYRELNIVILYG